MCERINQGTAPQTTGNLVMVSSNQDDGYTMVYNGHVLVLDMFANSTQ